MSLGPLHPSPQATLFTCRGEQHRFLEATALAGRERIVAAVLRLPANVALVSFDDAGPRQLLATVEQSTDAVAKKSSGLLSDAELFAELNAADALGTREDQIHGETPSPERQVAVFHRGANRNAEVFAARPTPVNARPPGDWGCVIDGAAPVTDRPIWPAHAF